MKPLYRKQTVKQLQGRKEEGKGVGSLLCKYYPGLAGKKRGKPMKQFVDKDLTNIHQHFKSLPEYLLVKDSSFNQKTYELMIISLLINWIIATVLAGMSLKPVWSHASTQHGIIISIRVDLSSNIKSDGLKTQMGYVPSHAFLFLFELW